MNIHNLLESINDNYNLYLTDITLYREMIGKVYFLKNNLQRYVFKLHRPFNTNEAIQSVEIIKYLREQNFPVVNIIPTKTNELYTTYQTIEGLSVGMLYEFVDGIEPNLNQDIMIIGKQVGLLHNLMAKYPTPIISRGKAFYIDRFLDYLSQLKFPDQKIKDLKNFGDEIWDHMKCLPQGFCHGDLHSGNMFKRDKEFVIIDFDVAANAYSIIDIASLCNDTNFNHLEASSLITTKEKFDRFYQGYSQYRFISEDEKNAMFYFIAARHYELIATITKCQGIDSLSQNFLNQQYEWLMKYKELILNYKMKFII